MKVAAFRAVITSAERLYRDGGRGPAAHALGRLAQLLSGRDALTVAAFAALLAKVPADATSDGGAPAGAATVAELQTVLNGLQAFCQAAGAKAAEKDLKALADALGAQAAHTVEAFCAQAQAWLTQEADKPKGRNTGRSKTAAPKGPAASEDVINARVDALRRAGTDRAAFEAALAALKADKSVKSPTVAEIARRYANTVTKYKSMAAAHADIASAFTQQARFANKVG